MADALIHEVEDSLRQEKLEKLWKENGGYLIAAILLTVLLTALFTGWNSWNTKINTRQTGAVIEALEQENQVLALEKVIDGLRPGQLAVSHLTAAGLLLRDDKRQEALKHYKNAARNKNIEPLFRDLAQLMAVRLEWSMEGGETEKTQTLLATLEPLWDDKNNPWYYHAHMQAALILAHADADYAAARDHLAFITAAGKSIPDSLLKRARILDQVYALKISKKKMSKKEPEG